MQCIDIHTHQIPAGTGKLFILNRFPDNSLPELPPGGFFSIGLHPWYVGGSQEIKRQMSYLEGLVSSDGVIAIGECGLDKVCKTDWSYQLEAFLWQCDMAEELNKPVIIHCVRAWNDIYHLHRKRNPKVPWILHGYNANDMVTSQLLQQNIFFSFGKALLEEDSPARKSFQLIPPEKIFLETDEESLSIQNVYEKASELMDIKVTTLAEQIEWNFRQVFVRQ